MVLEMKERDAEWIDGKTAQRQDRVNCGEVVLWKESPARELKPTAAYRLGVDKRKWVEKSQESHWAG
jgi:hypothetical protein